MNKRNGTNIIGFGGAFKYCYQETMQAHGITMKVCVHCAQEYIPVGVLTQLCKCWRHGWLHMIPKPQKPPTSPASLGPLALQEPVGKAVIGLQWLGQTQAWLLAMH